MEKLKNNMPVHSCKLPNGKSGYRWGSEGKCYRSKKDAIRQGVAIEMSKKRAGKHSEFDKADENNKQLMYDIAQELSFSEQLSINQELTKQEKEV